MPSSSPTREVLLPHFAAKDVIAALPVAHLLACVLFLYGYCEAFSSHLIAVISLEDIFAVSLREVGLVYFALLAPLALRTGLFDPLDRAHSGRTARLMDGPGAKQPLKLLAVAAFVVAVPLAFQAGDLSRASFGAPVKEIALFVLIAVLACECAAVWLSRRARFSSWEVIAIGAMLLAFGCLVFGAYKGFRDRHRDYDASHNFLECRTESSVGGLLIRRVGGSDLLLTGQGYVLAKDRCILYLDKKHDLHKPPPGDRRRRRPRPAEALTRVPRGRREGRFRRGARLS